MKLAVQLGHIGGRGGATHEEAVIMLIAPYVVRYLEESGHNVTTFNASIEREKANHQYAYDLAIFLHCDSGTATSTGVSVGYWEEEHPGSKRLAEILLNHYCRETGLKPTQGGYNISKGEHHYYGNTRFAHACKCVLLEMGYVSNPNERAFLVNECRRVGHIIADAINIFLGKTTQEENEMAVIGPGIESTKYGQEFYIGTPPGKTKSENVFVKVRNLNPEAAHVRVLAMSNDVIKTKELDPKQNKGEEVDVAALGVKGSTLIEVTSNAPVYISYDPR